MFWPQPDGVPSVRICDARVWPTFAATAREVRGVKTCMVSDWRVFGGWRRGLRMESETSVWLSALYDQWLSGRSFVSCEAIVMVEELNQLNQGIPYVCLVHVTLAK